MAGQKEWQEIFNMLIRKNMQPRMPYPARLSFRTEREIKAFPDKQNLREIMIIKPALHEILGGLCEWNAAKSTKNQRHYHK